MTSNLALGRLLWRPLTLAAIWMIAFAAVSPSLILSDRFDHGMQLGSREAITAILWVEAIALMATIGGFLGSTTREVTQPLFAFSVPSLRSIVLRQKLEAGLLLSLMIGAPLLFLGDRTAAFAAFGCALFFFTLGSSISDPLANAWWKVAGNATMLVAWLQAERLMRIAGGAPILWGAIWFTTALALLYREHSADAARRRAVLQPAPTGFAFGGSFKSAYATDDGSVFEAEFPAAAPVNGGLIEFLKSEDYEIFGARRYGWLKTLAGTLVFMCGFGYVASSVAMAGVMGLIVVSVRPHRLMGHWPYPISRPNRARLAFVSSLVDSSSYFVLAMVLATLLERSGLPRLTLFGEVMTPAKDLPLIPIGFIWSPIMTWIGATSVLPTQKAMKSAGWNFRRLVYFMAAILLLGFTFLGLMALKHRSSTTVAVVAGAALGVSVQIVFWLALRRYFARKDLI